jgi:tetratricopeptide (TPR) repeat protein
MRDFLRFAICSLCLAISFPTLAATSQESQAMPTGIVAEHSTPVPPSKQPDYSQKAYVIQKLDTRFDFHSDGTWDETKTVSVRVQSQAGIQAFGNLSAAYAADNQQADFVYVRVRKPDGTFVATPASNIQDMPAPITLQAPTYSDVRLKQIPVTNLNPGDTLEYQMHIAEKHAEAANQFWRAIEFMNEGIVLEEHVEVRVPANKYVNIVSDKVQPTIHQDGTEKVYEWKTSHLTDETVDQSKTILTPPKPAIQITTFESWQQLGEWYRTLLSSQIVVTPAIRQQEQQITAGLTTDDAKQRAIYTYVSTQFRYISLSFGVGRVQPHMADVVLQNKFGDCKDKHTIFAALMQAAGYPIWPAMIGSAIKLDPDVPSPAQFDHVISVLPQGKNFVWLDTTEEVAPFGMLMAQLRDKQALVIPMKGVPELKKTPANPPFPAIDNFSMIATLDDKAVLTGHVDMTLRGDLELYLRAAFHATPREKWEALGQNVSYLFGFGGQTSNFQADDPDNTAKPFHIDYDYTRKDYGGSDGKQFSPPLPPAPFLLGETNKAPEDFIPLGAAGEKNYRATVALPKGSVATLVADKTIQTDFAEYRETSSVKDGKLIAQRTYKVKTPRLPAARWEEYLKFVKAVQDRENLMVVLAASSANTPATGITENPKGFELLQQAFRALQDHKLSDAENALQQANTINPAQWDLWRIYAMLYDAQNKPQKAIDSLYKEVANHPDNTDANLTLGTALMRLKQYAEAVIFIKKAADGKDGTPDARILLGRAEFKAGLQDAGIADLETVMRTTQKPVIANDAAYELAVENADLAEARQYAQKALDRMETASGKITLTTLTNDDLDGIDNLANTWDTLGWLAFRQGRNAEAEKYVQAAWTLNQRGSEANHLGQIYEKQGKPAQAAHMYRLALAAGGPGDKIEIRKRLDALEARPATTADSTKIDKVEGRRDLSKLRTFPVPGIPKQFASAEFFVLLGPDGVEDVQFITGDESLRRALPRLRKIDFGMVFPDTGPEKIVRRGVLSCSSDTAQCDFVLLLPQSARAK